MDTSPMDHGSGDRERELDPLRDLAAPPPPEQRPERGEAEMFAGRDDTSSTGSASDEPQLHGHERHEPLR